MNLTGHPASQSETICSKHIIIKLIKIKDKEKILKTAKEKKFFLIQGNLQKAIGFLSTDLAGQEKMG